MTKRPHLRTKRFCDKASMRSVETVQTRPSTPNTFQFNLASIPALGILQRHLWRSTSSHSISCSPNEHGNVLCSLQYFLHKTCFLPSLPLVHVLHLPCATSRNTCGPQPALCIQSCFVANFQMSLLNRHSRASMYCTSGSSFLETTAVDHFAY